MGGRKLSRSSPSRTELSGIRAGLAILARGYEQYREGIQVINSKPSGWGRYLSTLNESQLS